MEINFKNANNEQREAINSIDGPLLIIAGPGTGKTYTLINRALNLIVNHGINPSNIFFATFTEKAANELITRLSNELKERNIEFNPNMMHLGTFHSICLKLLKDNISYTNLKNNFSVKDQFEQQYFIYQHFNEFRALKNFDNYIANGTLWDKCENILKSINRLTEELIDYRELLNSKNELFTFYGQLLKLYEELRIENNFLDFSSIQVETYKMLINTPSLADSIINSIDYVMIDEYQDTNYIQEKLSLLFASKNNNICVVGDDDQAIYRFRGATVRNILEFSKKFKNCKKVTLNQNYRSHRKIVEFYNEWMDMTTGNDFGFQWDSQRYAKKIIAVKEKNLDCDSVIQCSTKESEFINKKILNLIQKIRDSKKIDDLNQIAFLFRSVKSERVKQLADYLENNGIPVYSPRSNMFFERHEIKLLIGTLLLTFPNYITSIQNGEVNGDMAFYYTRCLTEAKNTLSDPEYKEIIEWIKFRASDHIFLSSSLDYSFSGLVYQMLQFQPLKSFLNIDLTKNIASERTVRNIGLLIQFLVKFEFLNGITVLTKNNIEKQIKRLFNQYIKFLYDGGITEYESEYEYAPKGCVSFLTIHQSKGLEFPIVFVGSQNAIPRKQYDENVEIIVEKYSDRGLFESKKLIKMYDFWRLYYVAFSRAQSLLVMICDFSVQGEPSKYFDYIYKKLPYELELSKFQFEKIKNTSIKKTYSFTSDINAYLTCPTQYKFFKELGFKPVRVGSTIFGTIVHETIEDINKAIIRGQKELITHENIEKWLEINYNTASKLNNYYLNDANLNSALDQVLSYAEKTLDNWKSVKSAELPISLIHNNYILNGKVDLILALDGKYKIVDFKTERKPEINKEFDKVENIRRQLDIYAYLIENNYNLKVDEMSIYYTSEKNGNPYLNFKREEYHIENTIKRFDDVVNKIENRVFNEKCTDLNVCRNCDLRFYCNRR